MLDAARGASPAAAEVLLSTLPDADMAALERAGLVRRWEFGVKLTRAGLRHLNRPAG